MIQNKVNVKHVSIDISETSTSSSSERINILDPKEGFRYMQELSNNAKLSSSIANSFSLTCKAHKNVQLDELEKLIQSTRNSNLRALLGRLRELKENETILLESSEDQGNFLNSFFIYGHFLKGKYDILSVTIIQVKPIRNARPWPCCVGGVVSGCLLGVLATPIAGAAVCAMVVSIGTLYYKYNTTRPFISILHGFILNELEKNGVVNVSSDGMNLQ